MLKENNSFVIGVDGGATKTTAALADLAGNILKKGVAGPSSPRNVGIDFSVKNVCRAINKVMPKKDRSVLSVFIGLPAVGEE